LQSINKKICIFDYSVGNIFSIQNALNYLGLESFVTDEPKKILESDGLILPGVGNFQHAMKNILQKKLKDTLYEYSQSNKPFLGTCLGMQLLFETSEETSRTEGLGILKGSVKKLPAQDNIKTNINWSKIKLNNNAYMSNLFNNMYFYFIHSYYIDCDNKLTHSRSLFGKFEFSSSIHYKNILATQFHLEKSGQAGLNILKKFFLKND